MVKKKIITLYWDEDDGNTNIEVHENLFGCSHLDFYTDAMGLIEEAMNSKDAVKEIVEARKK
jgi:hypothetical protein